METNKEKSKCCKCFGKSPDIISSGTGKIDGHICFCPCHKQFEPQDKEVLKQELIGLVRENVKIIEKYTNHIEPQVDKQLSQCNDCFDGDCCNGKVDGCTYHCCVKDKQQDIREEFIDDGYRIHYVKNGEDVGIVTEYKHTEYGHLFPKFLSQVIEQERERLTKNHFCCKYNTFKQSDFCDNCLNLTNNNHDNN